MVNTSAKYRQIITAGLASARQSLALLQSQIKAGSAEPDYWVERLEEVTELFDLIGEERADTDQQRRLAALYEVSKVLGSSLDLDEVLNQVMDAIIQLTGAERGFLLLFGAGDKPEVRVARNLGREALNEKDAAISHSVVKMVAETGKQVVTTNAKMDPRFAGQPSVVAHNLRSILCVPLRARGDFIGVIYVDNRVRSGVFDEADLEMLTTFATQAAMAIENARLFTMTDEALSRRVEELQRLQEIDRQLNESLDFEKVMDLTLGWAVSVTGADNGAIELLDPEEDASYVVAQYGETADHTTLLDEQDTAGEPGSFIAPIQREGRNIGAIMLNREDDQPFDDEARSFVTRLADHAAIAIENAQLYEAVQQANQAKSEFVSVVTHELRVPMTSISGYADMLPMVGELSEQQASFLKVIKASINRMSVLISDLSDISRIETGRMHIDLQHDVQIGELLESVLLSLQTEFDRRNHTVVVDIPDDLPPVKADPARVTQVLANLISNAYKYTPDGGTIALRGQAWDSFVQLDVQDTGIGMSPQELDKLFTKFWRSERIEVRDQVGTGLGLAITRNLIEMQGGELTVTSEKDKGTTFSMILPTAE